MYNYHDVTMIGGVKQTFRKIAILVVSTILIVTIGGCGTSMPTSPTTSQSQVTESPTRQAELNGVCLSVPENWYYQVSSSEKEEVQRILISAKTPSVHGDGRIYAEEIQKPLEGPWIELTWLLSM